MNKYQKHLKKYNSIIKKKNEKTSKRSYFDRLIARIFISSVIILMIISIDFLGIASFNSKIVKDEFSEQVNLFKIVNLFNGTFGSFFPIENTEPVFSSNIYDSVIYNKEKFENEVMNYSFDGVHNLVEGIVMKISRNEDRYYEVMIKGNDSFNYIYSNLEGIDVAIYQYVTKDKIIGKAPQVNNSYRFNLQIVKDQVSYDFHDQCED